MDVEPKSAANDYVSGSLVAFWAGPSVFSGPSVFLNSIRIGRSVIA
jgi:hypothetical protein